MLYETYVTRCPQCSTPAHQKPSDKAVELPAKVGKAAKTGTTPVPIPEGSQAPGHPARKLSYLLAGYSKVFWLRSSAPTPPMLFTNYSFISPATPPETEFEHLL
jgi:hypothetical protein